MLKKMQIEEVIYNFAFFEKSKEKQEKNAKKQSK